MARNDGPETAAEPASVRAPFSARTATVTPGPAPPVSGV